MNIGYRIHTLVWEMTMGCNLRCKHCASSCKGRLEDELTKQEAMDVTRQIISMHPDWISLSGGEPLLRSDWAGDHKDIKGASYWSADDHKWNVIGQGRSQGNEGIRN